MIAPKTAVNDPNDRATAAQPRRDHPDLLTKRALRCGEGDVRLWILDVGSSVRKFTPTPNIKYPTSRPSNSRPPARKSSLNSRSPPFPYDGELRSGEGDVRLWILDVGSSVRKFTPTPNIKYPTSRPSSSRPPARKSSLNSRSPPFPCGGELRSGEGDVRLWILDVGSSVRKFTPTPNIKYPTSRPSSSRPPARKSSLNSGSPPFPCDGELRSGEGDVRLWILDVGSSVRKFTPTPNIKYPTSRPSRSRPPARKSSLNSRSPPFPCGGELRSGEGDVRLWMLDVGSSVRKFTPTPNIKYPTSRPSSSRPPARKSSLNSRSAHSPAMGN